MKFIWLEFPFRRWPCRTAGACRQRSPRCRLFSRSCLVYFLARVSRWAVAVPDSRGLSPLGEPLINYVTPLRQGRPSGLSAEPALRVAGFRQADACLQTGALIAGSAESQRNNIIDQRLPGPFSPKKALRSFFCAQRCRLTVGDKPLLPDTLSAEKRYVACWLYFPSISSTAAWNCVEDFDLSAVTGQAAVGRQGFRPASQGRRRTQEKDRRAFSGGREPRRGAEPAGREPWRAAAALEATNLQ